MRNPDDINKQFKKYQTDLAILLLIIGIIAFGFILLVS